MFYNCEEPLYSLKWNSPVLWIMKPNQLSHYASRWGPLEQWSLYRLRLYCASYYSPIFLWLPKKCRHYKLKVIVRALYRMYEITYDKTENCWRKRIFRPPFLEKGNRTLLSTILSESPDQGLSYMGISGCSEEASKDFRYFIYEGKLLSERWGQKYRPVCWIIAMITYRNFTKYVEYIQEDRRIYCFWPYKEIKYLTRLSTHLKWIQKKGNL